MRLVKPGEQQPAPMENMFFALTGDLNQRLLSINKEKYKEHTSDIAVEEPTNPVG
jgi:hypothetical protein